jgi:hypothetical protein
VNESAAAALMRLEMIYQAAKGAYAPRAGELEKRKTAVAAFLFTGQCLADASDRALIGKVNEVVNLRQKEEKGRMARVKLGGTADGSGLLLFDKEAKPAVWLAVNKSGTSATLAEKGKEKRVIRP